MISPASLSKRPLAKSIRRLPARGPDYMPSPAEFKRAQDLMGDHTMSEEKKHRILCAEFPRRCAPVPHNPRERPGFRRMSARRLERVSQLLGGDGGDAIKANISDDGTDEEDDSPHGAQRLRTTAQQISVRQHRGGGWQKFHYDDCLRGVRKLQPDGRRFRIVWRHMPKEHEMTRLSEDIPAEEENVKVLVRPSTFRALSKASIRPQSQVAIDNAARAAAQTTIAQENVQTSRPGSGYSVLAPVDRSLQATLRRAERSRQSERSAGSFVAEMPRPAHSAAPRVRMPRDLAPSAPTASRACSGSRANNAARAMMARDPAPASATASAPIPPSPMPQPTPPASRPPAPASTMPPAASRPTPAVWAAPAGPPVGQTAGTSAVLPLNMQSVQYVGVGSSGVAAQPMLQPSPYPSTPSAGGHPAVGAPHGMHPLGPPGTAHIVQHIQPQYYPAIAAPMLPGPMYPAPPYHVGYGTAGASNAATALPPYGNGQASSAHGVAYQPLAPPGYPDPRPM